MSKNTIKTKKIKLSEIYELRCLKTADTFIAHDCAERDPDKQQRPLRDLAEAREEVLKDQRRVLVYAFNKKAEEISRSGHQVLITLRLLELYDELKESL